MRDSERRFDPERAEAFGRSVGQRLRTPELASATLRERVMARVRQEPRPASRPTTVRRAAEWLVAAGIGALIALGADRSPAEVGTTPSAPAGDTTYMVRFMVQAPDARQVALVGSFNGWDTSATALEPAASGLWVGTVALPAGNHEYSFVVDGNRWIADPAAPIRVADEFGVNSSIIRLGSS